MQKAWRVGKEPTELLGLLGVDEYGYAPLEQSPGLRSTGGNAKKFDRKLRLFACACCRRVWHLLNDKAGRNAVEVAEAFADGQATAKKLREATIAAARCTLENEEISDLDEYLANAALLAALQASAKSVGVIHAATNAAEASGNEAAEMEMQCDLLRDIFGDPFRPVPFDPTWRTPDVTGLAEGIYDGRAFAQMPILADALMDAGCDDKAILSHCRHNKPHVRGCWLVDMILGKS